MVFRLFSSSTSPSSLLCSSLDPTAFIMYGSHRFSESIITGFLTRLPCPPAPKPAEVKDLTEQWFSNSGILSRIKARANGLTMNPKTTRSSSIGIQIIHPRHLCDWDAVKGFYSWRQTLQPTGLRFLTHLTDGANSKGPRGWRSHLNTFLLFRKLCKQHKLRKTQIFKQLPEAEKQNLGKASKGYLTLTKIMVWNMKEKKNPITYLAPYRKEIKRGD